jgi:prepilin-type processing-associated H-X9-DG protein
MAPGSEGRSWRTALANELGSQFENAYLNKGVWHCPSAFRPPDFGEHWVYDEYGYNTHGVGQPSLTNHWLGLSEPWDPNRPPRPTARVGESQVTQPDEMIALGDNFYGAPTLIADGQVFGRTTDSKLASWSSDFVPPLYDLSESTKRVRARHQDKSNEVFCDGHVEFLTLKFLFADTNGAALSWWNRDHQPHRDRL